MKAILSGLFYVLAIAVLLLSYTLTVARITEKRTIKARRHHHFIAYEPEDDNITDEGDTMIYPCSFYGEGSVKPYQCTIVVTK